MRQRLPSNRHLRLLPLITLAVLLPSGGCGPSGGEKKPKKLQFQGEQTLLPDFKQDTGFVPADSPGQLRVVATADGGIEAAAAGRTNGGNLSAVPGSGELSMEGGLNLAIHAKIDFKGYKYEGELKSIDYGIDPSQTTFDPFLKDGEATLDSTLPAEELAEIPVPSIPIASVLVSVEGGTVTTSFRGTCAATRDGVGHYIGQTATSGTVELSGTIKLEIPVTGTETFGPFPITVDIPEVTNPIDLGARSLSTGKPVDDPEVCTQPPGEDVGVDDVGLPDGGTDSGRTEDGGNDDGSTNDDGGHDGGGTCQGCRLPDDDGPGQCVPGDRGEACGSGGATCTTCGSDESCQNGACVSQECTVDSDCGSMETCDDGTCRSSCSPSNCAGCCTSSGTCVDGTSAQSCGTGGVSCTSCGADQTCKSGSCVADSCQQSCSGCCAGSTCKSGDTRQACGSGGNACQSCAKGNECRQQGCFPRASSRWDIIVQSGSVPSGNGSAYWDNGRDDPDPYVMVTVDGTATTKSGQTRDIDGTTSPTWNETVIENVLAPDLGVPNAVDIKVYDEDPLNSDDLMAECSAAFQAAELYASIPGKVPCTGAGAAPDSTLYFRLEYNP